MTKIMKAGPKDPFKKPEKQEQRSRAKERLSKIAIWGLGLTFATIIGSSIGLMVSGGVRSDKEREEKRKATILIKKAEIRERNGDTKTAEEFYIEAAERYENIRDYERAAELYEKVGDTTKAEALLEKSLRD